MTNVLGERQDDGYDSPECEHLDATAAANVFDTELTQAATVSLAELGGCWELASVVHFLGIFGVQLSLVDASEPVGLAELSGALQAEDAASQVLLAKLHIALLSGTNLTRRVPLDEQWWPSWLAKWVKRRNAAATEREGRGMSYFEGSKLHEDDDSRCGANYNTLTARERLELLHLLCCDRLEAKRSLVVTSTDSELELPANVSKGIAGDDDLDALADADALVDGGVSKSARDSVSTAASGVPASWRPKPKVVDSKGRRYWHFAEAKALKACLFRSTRYTPTAPRLTISIRN